MHTATACTAGAPNSSSVVEGSEQGNTSLDPVLLGLVAGKLHSKHKVGGVASGGESACNSHMNNSVNKW